MGWLLRVHGGSLGVGKANARGLEVRNLMKLPRQGDRRVIRSLVNLVHPCASLCIRWSSYSVLIVRKFLPLVSPLRNSIVHSSRHALLFFWLRASSNVRIRSSTGY